MTRLLANESFPGDAVSALQAKGHDVVWIRIEAPGISDDQVLQWAEIAEQGISQVVAIDSGLNCYDKIQNLNVREHPGGYGD